ncbi:MAG: glycosyltransferase [Deltaproteobacteria bacterium]|nr:glycosyltransferase [Deltaproteobacteria bacterium]
MKILFVVHGFLPFSSTGVENYTFTLAKELKKRHDVLIYTARFDPLKEKYSDFSYQYNGVNVVGFFHDSTYKNFSETYSSEIADKKFNELVERFKPEIVHFQHLIFHSVGYVKALQKRDIPSVLTVHDFYYYCPNLGQRLFLGRFSCKNKTPIKCAICFRTAKTNITAIDKAIYKSSKRIDFLSKISSAFPELSLLIKWLRILRIHPTVDEIILREREMFSFLGKMNLIISPSIHYKNFYYRISGHQNIVYLDYGFEKRRQKSRLSHQYNVLTLGFIGTISRHKGAHLLVELAREMGDQIRIIVWGNDKNDLILSRKLKSLTNVEYRGVFKPEEKGKIYKEIDYLLVPSIWEENSPLVIHESILYRTPIIASAMGGNKELIIEGKNGFLFDPNKRGALIDLIKKILKERVQIKIDDDSVVMDISTHATTIEMLYNSLKKSRPERANPEFPTT